MICHNNDRCGVKNFIAFKPKKSYLYFIVKGDENVDKIQMIEKAGFEVKYISRWKEYDIRINTIEQFLKHKDMFVEIMKSSMDYYNVQYED